MTTDPRFPQENASRELPALIKRLSQRPMLAALKKAQISTLKVLRKIPADDFLCQLSKISDFFSGFFFPVFINFTF